MQPLAEQCSSGKAFTSHGFVAAACCVADCLCVLGVWCVTQDRASLGKQVLLADKGTFLADDGYL